MASESSTPCDPLLDLAVSRGWLSAQEREQLLDEAPGRALSPLQLAIELGWLTASELDILESLRSPCAVAPGYEILDVLGHGGLGVVYRARQIKLDRLVALKTVLLSRMNQPGTLARFEQEAKTVGRLRHPHIVGAYDFGTHDGRLFLAMELIEGEDLERRLRRIGALDELTTWSIVRQAAAGLAHAHDAGIVHRDIKPANLLLTAAPQGYALPPGVPMVKIGDFGLAFLENGGADRTRLTSAGATMGTPQYMAPEQYNDATVDLRADIYALGATAYHALAGHPPFSGDTTAEVLAHKLRGERTPIRKYAPHLTPQSVALLEAMLRDNPQDRLGDYGLLLKQIDALDLTDTSSPRHQVAMAETLDQFPTVEDGWRRRKKTSKKPFVVMTIGLLAMLLCLGLWMAGDARTQRVAGVRLATSGAERSLFDGQTLNGWSLPRGKWAQGRDAEGATVLAGEGSVCRSLESTGAPLPPRYQVALELDLQKAEFVEIHFGFAAEGLEQNVLRVDDKGVVLVHRDATGKVQTGGEVSQPSSSEPLAYHAVCLQRQASHWLVWYDDKLLGSVPLASGPESPRFELVVQGGQANFGSIALAELKEE